MSDDDEIEEMINDYNEVITALLSCRKKRPDVDCNVCEDSHDCPKFLRECIAMALTFIKDLIASKQTISEQFAERLHKKQSKLDNHKPEKGMYA
jgi:hypothetical protein